MRDTFVWTKTGIIRDNRPVRVARLNLGAFLLLLLVVEGLGGVTKARAQQGESAACEQARTVFESATAASDELRYADALRGFERAYELCPVATALFNAGLALRALGRHCDARDKFQRVLDDHAGSASADGLAEARRRRDEERSRCGTITVRDLDPEGTYTFRFDGRPVEPNPSGDSWKFDGDPGEHTLVIDREGYVSFRWEGRIGDGEHKEIQAVMEEIQSSSGSGGVHPAIWVTIAVVVAAGLGVGIFLYDQAQDLEPASNNVLTVSF